METRVKHNTGSWLASAVAVIITIIFANLVKNSDISFLFLTNVSLFEFAGN